jgi:choline-phosphate cytidylyltransferase
MTKVITYGTFDLLHHGHVRLLERAKKLGDHLIVGVTADDFDRTRGKINVQQSLMERIESVRRTGLADEIIVEEYEGQKIDDVRNLDVDIFTVGSDWVGKFDYLNEYCKVIYLDRTDGISSSDIRTERRETRIGLVGESTVIEKFAHESNYVNGVVVAGVCTQSPESLPESLRSVQCITSNYDTLLEAVDAVYLISKPQQHYGQIRKALSHGKHVLCESPITLSRDKCTELFCEARRKGLVLAESNKTAFSTAYSRLLLMAKTGKIGRVMSVDATCTSLSDSYFLKRPDYSTVWNSITAWGAKALLPVLQLLGCGYVKKQISSHIVDEENKYDVFTKIDLTYPNAVATLKVGKGVKSEGDLIISGTKGYIYVPSPWWKTDYFEIRYENPAENKRFFYQLDGEGIRYEIVVFLKAIEAGKKNYNIDEGVSIAIAGIMEDYYNGVDVTRI